MATLRKYLYSLVAQYIYIYNIIYFDFVQMEKKCDLKQVFFEALILLAGTRLTLRTDVKNFGGPDQIPAPKSSSENNYYLFNRVFDTTWKSKFWALKFLFLGQFFIFSC